MILLPFLAAVSNVTQNYTPIAPPLSNDTSQPYMGPIIKSTVSDNITLNHLQQGLYTLQIQVSYPVQTFNVSVDTGSKVLWIPSLSCTDCEIQNRFNASLSPTYVDSGQSFRETDGDEIVEGTMGRDTVAIQESSINVTSFKMLFASQEINFPYPQEVNGVMGLSNDQTQINIFQQAFFQNEINQSAFGLALTSQPFTSYLIYNNIDPKILGNLTWVKAADKSVWNFNILSVSYNGKPYNQLMQYAVLDSGQQFILIDIELYSALISSYVGHVCKAVSFGSDLYCPCRPSSNQKRWLPTISIKFDGITVDVPYQNYISDYYTQTSGQCELAIKPLNTEQSSYMVFGDPVLRSMIVVFNKTINSVGIYTYPSISFGYFLSAVLMIFLF